MQQIQQRLEAKGVACGEIKPRYGAGVASNYLHEPESNGNELKVVA